MCGPLCQCAQEHDQIDDPDQRQPQVGVPFRLSVFLALCDAEYVAGAGNGDEQLIAPNDEPRRPSSSQPRAAGTLHDIEGCPDQDVAPEGEDHCGGVQRPQLAEAGPRQVEVQLRKGELPGNDIADHETGDAPEDGGNCGKLDRAVHEPGENFGLRVERKLQDVKYSDATRRDEKQAMESHPSIARAKK